MTAYIPDPLAEAQAKIEELEAELAKTKKLCKRAAELFDTSNQKMSIGSASFEILLEQQQHLLTQLREAA